MRVYRKKKRVTLCKSVQKFESRLLLSLFCLYFSSQFFLGAHRGNRYAPALGHARDDDDDEFFSIYCYTILTANKVSQLYHIGYRQHTTR